MAMNNFLVKKTFYISIPMIIDPMRVSVDSMFYFIVNTVVSWGVAAFFVFIINYNDNVNCK